MKIKVLSAELPLNIDSLNIIIYKMHVLLKHIIMR